MLGGFGVFGPTDGAGGEKSPRALVVGGVAKERPHLDDLDVVAPYRSMLVTTVTTVTQHTTNAGSCRESSTHACMQGQRAITAVGLDACLHIDVKAVGVVGQEHDQLAILQTGRDRVRQRMTNKMKTRQDDEA